MPVSVPIMNQGYYYVGHLEPQGDCWANLFLIIQHERMLYDNLPAAFSRKLTPLPVAGVPAAAAP